MYRSEKRKEEFEESELSLSQRIIGVVPAKERPGAN